MHATVGRFRSWLRRRLERRAPRVLELLLLLTTRRRVFVDAPVDRRPRYGHGRPPHPELQAFLETGRDRYEATLGQLLELRGELARIARTPDPERPHEPNWDNPYLPIRDGVALYGLMARTNPGRYVEIGSGNSTKFVHRAIRDHGLRTRITSIDPKPRAEIDEICDTVLRRRLERGDLSMFSELGEGDVLFMDGSHRLFIDSDATVFFMEVFPRLRPGVMVQVHDIFLPSDYPAHWDTFFGEQYMLGAYLLANPSGYEVVLPNYFVATDDRLSGILAPLWSDLGMRRPPAPGFSFWLTTR